jgi:hypothetical protein
VKFRLVEDQRIRYSWIVEADSRDEALSLADQGVPDDARTDRFGSDTWVDDAWVDPEAEWVEASSHPSYWRGVARP